MVINFSLSREYTPTWNGNQNEDEPIVIEHKAPTLKLKSQLVPNPKFVFTGEPGSDKQNFNLEYSVNNRKVFEGMVTKVRNLTVNGKNITSPKDLMQDDIPAQLGGLIDEVGQYLQSLLQETEINEKN